MISVILAEGMKVHITSTSEKSEENLFFKNDLPGVIGLRATDLKVFLDKYPNKTPKHLMKEMVDVVEKIKNGNLLILEVQNIHEKNYDKRDVIKLFYGNPCHLLQP